MRAAAIWLLSCLAAGAAAAEDYTMYAYIVTNDEMRAKYGEHLDQIVDYEGSPLDLTGLIFLNGGLVGNYPFAGIHMVESDPGYMAEHFNRIKYNLPRFVPAGYDGIVMIDYERWWAAWDHTKNDPSPGGPDAIDKDFKDDWEEYVERYRPELLAGKSGAARELALRDSYEEAAVRFMVATLMECKRHYPDAKWGYYNYPRRLYGSGLTPPGTIGYGDLSHYASEVNDRLAPLWDAIDVTMPVIYPLRTTVVNRKDPKHENTPEQQYQFIASHVLESKRLAPDKLCIPLGSTRYFGHPDPKAGSLNERNTWMQFSVPRDVGADGVLLWGDAIYDEYAMLTAEYMNEIAVPAARQLWESWYPGRSPGGGSSRGGSSTREPVVVGGRTAARSPAGGEHATPAPIPGHLRVRYSGSLHGQPIWEAIRTGATRISLPSHIAAGAGSDAVYRGGRIIGRRGAGYGDSPPQHIPAYGSEDDQQPDGAGGEE